MKIEDYYWNNFSNSGKIGSYLVYKLIQTRNTACDSADEIAVHFMHESKYESDNH